MLLNLNLYDKFWKNLVIFNSSFEKKADTLDLLLFQCKAFTAKMQRCVTKCDYDHIGIILRYTDNEIVLFEATGNVIFFFLFWNKKKRMALDYFLEICFCKIIDTNSIQN